MGEIRDILGIIVTPRSKSIFLRAWGTKSFAQPSKLASELFGRIALVKSIRCSLAFGFSGICLAILAASCMQAQSPKVSPGETASPAAVSRPDYWNELVAAAQKEGTLTIYGTALEAGVVPLRDAFKQRFGVDLEFVNGRPTEVVAKLAAERRAGLYLADVGHFGNGTSLEIQPMGITAPVSDLLVLPEVKDPQNWNGGKIAFLDREGRVVVLAAMAIPHAVVNADAVKEGELSSLLDILHPKWKGKIVLSDPTISGTSANLMSTIYTVFGEREAMEIFKRLAAQEPAITRDQRLVLEWVARDKYSIGLGQSMALFSEFRRLQVPIRAVNLKEPRFIGSGPSHLIVFTNGPHPKATQLYANWLLSKEGSYLWSQMFGYASLRQDVTREGLDPDTLPKANDVFMDEEQIQLSMQMRDIAAGVFGHLLK